MKINLRIKPRTFLIITCLLLATLGVMPVSAKVKKKAGGGAAASAAPLTEEGNKLKAQYEAMLASLRAEITKALPAVSEQKKAALQNAQAAVEAAQATADTANASASTANGIKAKIDNWKKFWIGRAKKDIAKAQADLAAATTDAARQAAQKKITELQANLAEGEKKVKEAEAELARAKVGQDSRVAAKDSADATLARARLAELNAAKAILADMEPLLAGDQLDPKLVKGAVLAHATPYGLAAFAQQGAEQKDLVEKLLADTGLMKQMLEAGGAEFGKYGQAMQIYTAIQKASPKAKDGIFQRLALAVSLEFAAGIKQSNPEAQTDAPVFVDPVKRYLHYEKAYLDGELDPAFKNFSAWEYRLVVGCDAPDQILTWGREALRNYRPDHVTNPNYGWRYSAAVKTEVPYTPGDAGKNDLPSLQNYQNIAKNAGVCGRRAFFGRFILRSFGIPVWGVTQHAHAALSHWTPKGWVVNLGAGYEWSWWDKAEESLSGTQFLLETKARKHTQEFLKVLRAQWVSRILGEEFYNDRKQVAGGLWSSAAHYDSALIAAHDAELGPLGQELAEANEPQGKETFEQAPVKSSDQQVAASPDGSITIPAVAHGQAAGTALTLKNFAGGMQLNCSGGFKTQYSFTAPQAGKYVLTARVATLQEGQKFLFAANSARASIEVAVPYTIGMWQQTKPVEVNLVKGQNILNFESKEGSRGVAIKQFTLTLAK